MEFMTPGAIPIGKRAFRVEILLLQKALGWFGGYGFRGSMTYFTKSGFPGPGPSSRSRQSFSAPSVWRGHDGGMDA